MLDTKQKEVALAAPEDRILVLAGPGTGKTEVAAWRLVHLLDSGLGPAQIQVLSFSRNAARTLCRRIEKLEGISSTVAEELRHLSVRTFDSWSFRQLRLLGFPPGDLLRNGYESNIVLLVEQMRGVRREECRQLLGGLRHIIVDEFQDLAGVRGALVLELLSILCSDHPGSPVGFTVLGDEAQAIYGFAGNTPGYEVYTPQALFAEVRRRYRPRLRELVLGQNYRAVEKLAKFAEALRSILMRELSPAAKRDAMLRVLSRVPPISVPLSPQLLTEAGGRSTAILTRTNGEAIRVAQLIWGKGCAGPAIGIDLRTMSQRSSQPAWVGATLGPLQDSTVTHSRFSAIYQHLWGRNEAGRIALGIPDEKLCWARLCHAVSVPASDTSVDLRTLRERIDWPDIFPDDDDKSAMLRIMTIHQSKGMEFDNVALLEGDASAPATAGAPPDADDPEEASVIFVAMTRAGRTIKRIPLGTGYSPLRPWHFNNHSRWMSWKNGWVNMELGIAGDLDVTSFVDPAIHGGTAEVDTVQQFLANRGASILGHKVMLCRRPVPGTNRSIYGIHIQDEDRAGLLIGATSEQVTRDLLNLLWSKGYSLPATMFNLRIAAVATFGIPTCGTPVAPRYASSGLWLGAHIYGTADFKSLRRQS